MNNKYLAIVLSIIAVIVVVYQVFLRKPTRSIQQQLNQPQQSQPMFSTHGASSTGQTVKRTTTAAPTTMGAGSKSDSALIIDYNSEILLKRLPPELVVPYPQNELPLEYGTKIFSKDIFKENMPTEPQYEQEVEFQLNAIIIDETRRIAIINDKILKVGDNIQGAQVMIIAKSKVVLKVRSEEFMLSTNSRIKKIRLIGNRNE